MSKITERESQMILRVPEDIAEELNDLFEDEQEGMEEYIDITPHITEENGTTFKFKFKNQERAGTLVNLPCIIESHKSVDSINMFKSNDISQMIVVHEKGEKELREDDRQYKRKVEDLEDGTTAVIYEARDGLTPPTKCIRSRYFRKKFDVPYKKVREIEEEMTKILDEIKKNKKDGEGSDNDDDNDEDAPNLTVQLSADPTIFRR